MFYLIGLVSLNSSFFAVFSPFLFRTVPMDKMSHVRIFLPILLLSAVMLEAAPGRWDPHEGSLTNCKSDCKIEESLDQSIHLFSLSVV